MAVVEMGLETRACECCGGSDLEPVWSNQSVVQKAVHAWRFTVHVALCRTCGFCFVSPGPKPDDIAKYYAEGLSGYKGIGLPYSIDRRLPVLERYAAPEGVFAEIGGDQPGEFHQRCGRFFRHMVNVEVSDDSPADHRSVHDLPENSVDVLAHYDVLEHVPTVRDFLRACQRALRPGGVMVCEMPDIRLYPRNLHLLEFEHVNHFSSATLGAIAASVGFDLIEVGHVCSRAFGFLSVFRKTASRPAQPVCVPFEYIDALGCLRGGIEQIALNATQIEAVRVRITESGRQGQRITLWGVTDFLRRLLDGFSLPASARVVDSDPRRKTHLADDGVMVFQPGESREHMAGSAFLVICAPRYTGEILTQIARGTGRSFGPSEYAVVGSGPSGEALS